MNKIQLQHVDVSSPQGNRVLIISKDVIGVRVAGPGVRYLEMAKKLSDRHRVTLMAPGNVEEVKDDRFCVQSLTSTALKEGLRNSSVVISQGFAYSASSMATSRAAQVFDLYAPLQLEMVEAGSAGHSSRKEAAFYRSYISRRLRLLMQLGDYFICASERQRDLWLGQLAAAGRINRANFTNNEELRQLIDCVPFGISGTAFPDSADRDQARGRARREIDGINENDFLLLWGGGIWPWLDPQTAIRAVALAAKKDPRIKLLFLGSGHPNPGVTTGLSAAENARKYAEELGVLGRCVLFNKEWVPFSRRVEYLAAANAGLLAHRPGIETRFAFRTRLLDCFWAGLPVLATSGDELSALTKKHGAGITVPPGDPQALAEAIVTIANNREMQSEASSASATLGERFHWDRVFAPLERFVDQPHTRHSRGETGITGSRWAAIAYTMAVVGLGVRHRIWRRALGKLFTRKKS